MSNMCDKCFNFFKSLLVYELVTFIIMSILLARKTPVVYVHAYIVK